ncbi:MAG TPA: hypothetical protein VHX61_04655 [Rhizomicrobium sp.]|jgi:hypothetical protein|nr:hypothetical protein [Rhizomicrobium sp.]
MKSRCLGVEFALQPLEASEWLWEVYPTSATTRDAPVKGRLRETIADAIAACFSAIDALQAQSRS